MTLNRTQFAAAFVALVLGVRPSLSACLEGVRVHRSSDNVVAADAGQTLRALDPSFFGFNIEWVEFQIGLFEADGNRVRTDVVQILRGFPGAVYRFPGGSKSNQFTWSDSVGPSANRPKRPYVTWRPPLRADFGVDEYLDFVRDVGGEPWYVANVYGGLDGELPSTKLASEAGELARYLKRRRQGGAPAILRWELGNELDRGSYRWTPPKLAQAAHDVALAIKAADPTAKFVHLQQEYSAMATAGYSAGRYNRELRSALKSLDADLALHTYYDGVPENPSVEFFLRRLCEVVDESKTERAGAGVWITEHGRVPNGFWSGTPKSLWRETANLSAAIGLADFLISVSQIPEVRGAFTHSLVASGSPWPMFHKFGDGRIEPSATLLAMQMLSQSMKPKVVAIKQSSSGTGSQQASYTVRSAVLADHSLTSFTLWSINRSAQSQLLEFKIANAPKSLRFTKSAGISNVDPTVGNDLDDVPVRVLSDKHDVSVVGSGVWKVRLPPNSVNTFLFQSN